MPGLTKTFEPNSIKDIQLVHGVKHVTFDNFELNFLDFEHLSQVNVQGNGVYLLSIKIKLDGVHVVGDIYKYENNPEMGFTLYDVQDFDMKYDLTAKKYNSQTFQLTGRHLGSDTKGPITDLTMSTVNRSKKITSYCTCKISLDDPRTIASIKGKISFRITLKNELQQNENLQSCVTSFFCNDAIENLIQEKNFIMKCDGQEFHFNKTLLCMISDVFRTMIQGNLGTESQSGLVEIVDFSPDTIRAFQRIVFENKVLNGQDPIIDLMMFADKYFIIPLKQKCIKGLVTYLSNENVYDAIKIAAQIQDDDLINLY